MWITSNGCDENLNFAQRLLKKCNFYLRAAENMQILINDHGKRALKSLLRNWQK